MFDDGSYVISVLAIICMQPATLCEPKSIPTWNSEMHPASMAVQHLNSESLELSVWWELFIHGNSKILDVWLVSKQRIQCRANLFKKHSVDSPIMHNLWLNARDDGTPLVPLHKGCWILGIPRRTYPSNWSFCIRHPFYNQSWYSAAAAA
jgi:hypothetical protein